MGCWKETCTDHACLFTDLCLSFVQDLAQDLGDGEREGFNMDFSSLRWHGEFCSFLFASSICHSVDVTCLRRESGCMLLQRRCLTAGGEGLQHTGSLWPSDGRAEHETKTGAASLGPVTA